MSMVLSRVSARQSSYLGDFLRSLAYWEGRGEGFLLACFLFSPFFRFYPGFFFPLFSSSSWSKCFDKVILTLFVESVLCEIFKL